MPPRVVSLLPAATEMLALIGGESLLVGRSHECDYPPSVESLPALTRPSFSAAPAAGSYSAVIDQHVRAQVGVNQPLTTLDTALLRELRPDVILTQDLCHVCAVDEDQLRSASRALSPSPRIVTLTAQTVEGMLDDLMTVGQAAGLEPQALNACVQLRERFFRAADFVNPYAQGPVVGFLEWTDPLYIAGHWTVQLIERAGGRHPLNPAIPLPTAGAAAGPQHAQARAGRSIRVDPEIFLASRPDRLIICPCGLDLDQTRTAARELFSREGFSRTLGGVPAALVDGHQMFNRAGPRLADAFEWLVAWLHDRPELIPRDFPWEAFAPLRA